MKISFPNESSNYRIIPRRIKANGQRPLVRRRGPQRQLQDKARRALSGHWSYLVIRGSYTAKTEQSRLGLWRSARDATWSIRCTLKWFVTKRRGKVFNSAHLKRLEEICRDVCSDFEAELKEFDGERDHVHLLVIYPPIEILRQYIENQARSEPPA